MSHGGVKVISVAPAADGLVQGGGLLGRAPTVKVEMNDAREASVVMSPSAWVK